MEKERGRKGEKKRKARQTDALFYLGKSCKPLWPDFPQRSPSCTSAAHAPPIPPAFSTNLCCSQGPGPSAASKADRSIARHFPKASMWFTISDATSVYLSCFLAHFAPKDRATVISLIVCLFPIHRWAKGALCWRSRQGTEGQRGGQFCSGMSTRLVSARLKPAWWASANKFPSLTWHQGPRLLSPQLWTWASKKENSTLTPKFTGPPPCVGTGLSHRWVLNGWHSGQTAHLGFPFHTNESLINK